MIMLNIDRVELLTEAQQKINEAIRLIREALEDTSEERSAEAYILGHLENWANGTYSMDTTCQKLIDGLLSGKYDFEIDEED
jgi:hypothetical protein